MNLYEFAIGSGCLTSVGVTVFLTWKAIGFHGHATHRMDRLERDIAGTSVATEVAHDRLDALTDDQAVLRNDHEELETKVDQIDVALEAIEEIAYEDEDGDESAIRKDVN